MSDFPCLHGNERYGTCDDVSTEIASIFTQEGICQGGFHLKDESPRKTDSD